MSEQAGPTPVFLLSLPRSGSTLLQRILGSHADVSTSPEPTFLLPLLHLDRSTDTVATFDQKYTSWAVQDFVSSLPNGRSTYLERIAEFACGLYSDAADDGVRYHVDKTPKYHLIAHELLELFPEAPIIVLWRNPLSVIASIMATWGRKGGQWNLADFRIDLYEGIVNLVNIVDDHPDRVIQVRYEDLVARPEAVVSGLFERLGLTFDPAVLENFGEVQLEGRVQDPNVSTAAFGSLRSDRTEQWKTILANPVRRWWCGRYLNWLGPNRLASMGYELGDLQAQLHSIPASSRFLMSDAVRIPGDVLTRMLETRLLSLKLKDLRSGRRLLAHK